MHTELSQTTPSSSTFDAGRDAQYRAMMQALEQLQARYKGVRGELLAKVRDELSHLNPKGAPVPASPPPPPAKAARVVASSVEAPAAPQKTARPTPPEGMLPSCRVCGRGMTLDAAQGNLVCSRGHVRLLT